MRYSPYPKYKPTSVEWLGKVPHDWNVKAIKRISPVLRGASPRPIDDPTYFDDEGEYAWVRISDVTSAGMYLNETTQRLSELGCSLSVKLRPGALFLSIAGSVGKPCISKIKCCIHDGFVYFPRWKGDTRFLYYLFACGEPYKGLGKLGTQLNLNTDTVGAIVTGFPSLSEQLVIANFLDRETDKIDTLIKKKQELIEKLNEKRTALISQTVTRGLSPEAARAAGLNPHPRLKPSGIEWLGEIPDHWETPPLYTRYAIDLGKMLNEDRITGDYLVPYLRNVDIQWDRINITDLPEMDIGPREHARYTVRTGDLVVCEGGEVGRSAIVTSTADGLGYQKALHRLRPLTANEIPRFMFYTMFWAAVKGIFIAEGNPNTIPHLTGEKLRRYRFPAPSRPEQEAIANTLDIETAKINRLIAKLAETIDRLHEHRTALITAAVTGKIDVRHEGEAVSAAHRDEIKVKMVQECASK